MPRVLLAAAPYSQTLGSSGNATRMLICQHDFPDTFLGRERLVSWDHDRAEDALGLSTRQEIFERHTGGGELEFRSWAQSATKGRIISFISEFLGQDPRMRWTGCRVLGTTNPSNGHTVWTLELFRKSCSSKTLVYTGANAPNVEAGKLIMSREGIPLSPSQCLKYLQDSTR